MKYRIIKARQRRKIKHANANCAARIRNFGSKYDEPVSASVISDKSRPSLTALASNPIRTMEKQRAKIVANKAVVAH